MLKAGPASPGIAELLERHPERVLAWNERLGDATIEVAPAQLVPVMGWLRDESGERFESLCDLTAVDRLGREPRFELVYHLRSPGTRARLRVKAAVEAQIASLVPLWPAADWLEREVFDLYGIDFAGHPDLRRILLAPDFEGHPLRKDFAKQRRPAGSRPPARVGPGQADVSKPAATGDLHAPLRRLELGPEHPTTRGALAFRLQIEGERIADLEVEIGYLHRGFEKECESRSWYQAIPYVERLETHSSTLSSVGFCLALEKLLEIETPLRCHWLRVLASELSRVGDHLNRLAQLALSLQAADLFERASAARELGWDLQEALCGARVTTHAIRIGGLAHAMPPGFPGRCRQGIAKLRQQLRAIAGAPTRSRAFVDRLRGCGVLSREDCLRYSVTGPLLRAAGVASDLRKDEPYLCYDEIDFDVPVGEIGDNYDRHLVCMEEMQQSLRIVEQCLARLEQLGPGPVDVFDARVRWPGKERVSARLQDLIQHFKGVTEGPPVPAGEVYAATESANGELGYYLVSDGTSRPVKLRCRAPSFFHLQPLPQMARGARLADLAPTFDLLNAVAGDCDR